MTTYIVNPSKDWIIQPRDEYVTIYGAMPGRNTSVVILGGAEVMGLANLIGYKVGLGEAYSSKVIMQSEKIGSVPKLLFSRYYVEEFLLESTTLLVLQLQKSTIESMTVVDSKIYQLDLDDNSEIQTVNYESVPYTSNVFDTIASRNAHLTGINLINMRLTSIQKVVPHIYINRSQLENVIIENHLIKYLKDVIVKGTLTFVNCNFFEKDVFRNLELDEIVFKNCVASSRDCHLPRAVRCYVEDCKGLQFTFDFDSEISVTRSKNMVLKNTQNNIRFVKSKNSNYVQLFNVIARDEKNDIISESSTFFGIKEAEMIVVIQAKKTVFENCEIGLLVIKSSQNNDASVEVRNCVLGKIHIDSAVIKKDSFEISNTTIQSAHFTGCRIHNDFVFSSFEAKTCTVKRSTIIGSCVSFCFSHLLESLQMHHVEIPDLELDLRGTKKIELTRLKGHKVIIKASSETDFVIRKSKLNYLEIENFRNHSTLKQNCIGRLSLRFDSTPSKKFIKNLKKHNDISKLVLE